jgi:hypothetical protein
VKSNRIEWNQSSIDELKRALGEGQGDDEEDLEQESTLDYPWVPEVVSQSLDLTETGTYKVSVVLGFDDIDGAEDYEVRITPLEDEVNLNPILGPNWQPSSDKMNDGGDQFYGSFWSTAAKINSSTAMVFWTMTDYTGTTADTDPLLLRARTISLDSNMALGTPFTVTSIPGADIGDITEGIRTYNLSDGRIVVVVPSLYKSIPASYTFLSTDIILLSNSGSFLDRYRHTPDDFWTSEGEVVNDTLFLGGTTAYNINSFKFTGDTITLFDTAVNVPSPTYTLPFLLVTDSYVFAVNGPSDVPQYWYIDHTDGSFGAAWTGPIEMTPTGSNFFPWEEDGYMRPMQIASNQWVYHGRVPDSGDYAWALATFIASGNTLTIGNIRKFGSPSGPLGVGGADMVHPYKVISGLGLYQGPIAVNWLFKTVDGRVGSLNEIRDPDDYNLVSVQIFDVPLGTSSPIYRKEWSMVPGRPEQIEGLGLQYDLLGGVPIAGDNGILLIQNWQAAWVPPQAFVSDNLNVGLLTWLPLE